MDKELLSLQPQQPNAPAFDGNLLLYFLKKNLKLIKTN